MSDVAWPFFNLISAAASVRFVLIRAGYQLKSLDSALVFYSLKKHFPLMLCHKKLVNI